MFVTGAEVMRGLLAARETAGAKNGGRRREGDFQTIEQLAHGGFVGREEARGLGLNWPATVKAEAANVVVHTAEVVEVEVTVAVEVEVVTVVEAVVDVVKVVVAVVSATSQANAVKIVAAAVALADAVKVEAEKDADASKSIKSKV